MLPTPSTSHVSFDTIYEPSEDSYLFLDTLSSASESAWLTTHFHPSTSTTTPSPSPSPLILEVGSGSGVVLAFVTANSQQILGRSDVLALGTDVNRNACAATKQTVLKAIEDHHHQQQQPPSTSPSTSPDLKPTITSTLLTDLASPIRPGTIDILLFNPPYVPTPELPSLPTTTTTTTDISTLSRSEKFEQESYYLSLTYAGGKDGMETTERLLGDIPRVLSPRGVAYVLLCAQNRPREVVERIRGWEGDGKGRWCEKLVNVRVWREFTI